MPTYKEALQVHEHYALDNGKEPSGIKILLLYFSQLSNTELYTHLSNNMPTDHYRAFQKAVDDYVIHSKPVQHITGEEVFFGHPFKVNKDVMIPRCETEELAEKSLMFIDEIFPDKTNIELLDIGTGSGCLAITLSLEEPRIQATAVDISQAALSVAKTNSEALSADVTFKQGNLLEPVKGKTFDVIISNPPYIPNDEALESIVKDHEPSLALFGGKDGLDPYRKILKDIKPYLNDPFLIAFEHAYDKAKELRKMIKKELKNVHIVQIKDMQGKDRMTFITKKK